MTDSLEALERRIPDFAVANTSVSAWSVGMQLHHALLATNGIARAIVNSVPSERKPTFNAIRSLVLLTGKIPRGRGQSPKGALPSPDITQEELCDLLVAGRQALAEAAESDPRAWWKHLAFGVMQRDTAIKFVHIHNRHHLSIVDDILSM